MMGFSVGLGTGPGEKSKGMGIAYLTNGAVE
ncbi:hypothetical protein J2Z58_002305 [Halobacillus andaensis]|nr:hypothetical protein [Halobacillus andaensis]